MTPRQRSTLKVNCLEFPILVLWTFLIFGIYIVARGIGAIRHE